MSNSILFAILLLAPLVGFFINGFNWRSYNGVLAGTIGTVAAGISFLCSLCLVFQLAGEGAPKAVSEVFGDWMTVGSLHASFGFTIDHISAIMVLVVTGVGMLIHLFSIGYMANDERPAKYFAYLNFFLFNMLLLVLGDNLLVMFIGWEGVGLCSYLLIGFWFSDPAKAAAGMKAFITNRIGDAGFLLGIFAFFFIFGTVNFSEIVALAPKTVELSWVGPITLACLFLFIGASAKSAQIPLYVWLPDAMAGPTPVSALIHAATMVTAGVYMIVRLNPIFLAAPNVLHLIAIIGAATAFFAATVGLTQFDIKKVLAYSTVSQLGYMFLACGVGAFGAAMFHLMTHAFFKALMFLGSGSVIHSMHEEQDIRKMGGLSKYMPITHATFAIGWLAIIGIPPFAGFFSKDEILWQAFSSPFGSKGLYIVGVVAAILTAFYMTRLMALTFWGKSRVNPKIHPHESSSVMTIPLIVLAILSIVGGWIGIPHVLGGTNWIEHWFDGSIVVPQGVVAHSPVLEISLMGVSTSLAVISAIIAFFFYVVNPELPRHLARSLGGVYSTIYNKYFVDELYENVFVTPLVDASKGLWAYVDVNFIDRITYFVGDLVKGAGNMLRTLQNGNMQQYALYIAMGVAATIFLILR